MLEQLNRYFKAARNLRRTERKLVRLGAQMELEELAAEVSHPKLRARIQSTLASIEKQSA